MAQDIRQTLKQEQSLTLTPQLKRSLEILQAPNLELEKIIENELQTNPLLDEVPPQTLQLPPEYNEEDDSDDYEEKSFAKNKNDGIQYIGVSGDTQSQLKRDYFINSIPDKYSLNEYLLNEAAVDIANQRVEDAFRELVGLLDERGFLAFDYADVLKSKGFSKEETESALEYLQACEPSGIGALDMRGSLMLQLEHNHRGNSLAYRILENHYELLVKRKVEEIAKLENCKTDKVEIAIAEISKLETSPARAYEPEPQEFIYPDMIFYFDSDNILRVVLPEDRLPHLMINQEYRQMSASGSLNSAAADYVREKIKDAKNVMEALVHRQSTLLKIGESILKRQRAYFTEGISALRPMTMQDVADDVSLHASTVGRAVSGKYAQTPFGIIALKSFFSGGYSLSGGAEVASSSVKEKIKKIISQESSQKPLSDSKIADILAEDGVVIARRTVAKYREELGIAPKNLRKRF